MSTSIYTFGFSTVFRVYLVPYLWVNHWLVLITFLQHTDPLLPPTVLLSSLSPVVYWLLWATTSLTHVLHHISSEIPHYNAWEDSDALCKCLELAVEVCARGAFHFNPAMGYDVLEEEFQRPAPEIVCVRGAFHFNPTMGYDAATYSGDEDFLTSNAGGRTSKTGT
ncbi:hypothetical protein M405DRAFT_867284 [Rhizopogon salebrosus TDB-379]|nr:hypothetical protein M405DRAFT_867284 [Rhizopogon salebrosus TDB-379]